MTGARVKELRKRLGLTQAELAKRIGFVRHYISLVENGREPSQRFIRALTLIEQSPEWHVRSSAVFQDQQEEYAMEKSMQTRRVPLLTWAQAGTAEAWESLPAHKGFVGFNLRDSGAIAVQIRGDSMAPQFPHGSYAIVYPSWEAKSGDLVIARLKDGTVMFQRLHVNGNQLTFISNNPVYPPVTVDRSKVWKLLPVGCTFQTQL